MNSRDTIKIILYLILIIATMNLIYQFPFLQNESSIILIVFIMLELSIWLIIQLDANKKIKLMSMALLFFFIGMEAGIVIPSSTPRIIESISVYLLIAVSLITFIFLLFSYKDYKDNKDTKINPSFNPKVSILAPCFNEELTIENCVKGLLQQTYKNIEIIIINDGSTDKTNEVGKKLADTYSNVIILNKENGGKASALNYGLSNANGEIIICIDGDTVFDPQAVEYLIQKFIDPEVMAVAGNPRVANASNILTKIQNLEYSIGFNTQRRAMSQFNCIPVISGGIGAFRKEKLTEIGGYSSDTITEDLDLTLAFAKNGWKRAFESKALAYTEAPANIKDFMKQRYRWYYGKYQTLTKYNDMIFNPKYGSMGLFGLPYFQYSAWLDTAISVITIAVLIEVFAFGLLVNYIITFSLFLLIAIAMFFYVAYIDNIKKPERFIPYIFIQTLFYIHLLNYINLRTWMDYHIGKQSSWNKFARTGTNTIKNLSK